MCSLVFPPHDFSQDAFSRRLSFRSSIVLGGQFVSGGRLYCSAREGEGPSLNPEHARRVAYNRHRTSARSCARSPKGRGRPEMMSAAGNLNLQSSLGMRWVLGLSNFRRQRTNVNVCESCALRADWLGTSPNAQHRWSVVSSGVTVRGRGDEKIIRYSHIIRAQIFCRFRREVLKKALESGGN